MERACLGSRQAVPWNLGLPAFTSLPHFTSPCTPALPAVPLPQDIQRFVLRSLGEKRQLYYAMEHLGTSFKDPVSNPTSLHPTSV